MFFLILCLQTKAQNQDSINKPTTLENIESYSKKNRFFKTLHSLIVKPKQSNKVTAKKTDSLPTLNLDNFNGKIIRNIDIQTYDPFGYSLSDSTKIPQKKVEKGGNWLHIKSKKFTIRNMLLIKPNQPFEASEIKESERLVRSQRFVRQITITPVEIQNNPDSIDLKVKVLDSWSLYPTGTISSSTGSIRLVERNFAGLGHYFSNQYSTRFKEKQHFYRSQYQINNVANTFINVGGIYQIDFLKNYQKTLYLSRPFYSPQTKYAGGITASQYFLKDSIPDIKKKSIIANFKYNLYDFWFGRAFRISKDDSTEITNLVASLRYNVINYKERPKDDYIPESLYSNHQMVLGSLAISSNQYIQTKYLFNYGIIEDIAVGKTFSITGGYQWRDFTNRPYIGTKFALGKYINNHFYGINTEWGSYFNQSHLEQTVFRTDLLYFSKAFEYKDWKFRQFINAEIVYGSHRLDYEKDRINLNGKYGIDGFHSYSLKGTKKILLSVQTQSYAPGSILGFRFSPYLSAAFGWIGEKNQTFVSDNVYSKIAAGIMLNNDYLIFQNVQLSFAFYPTIPGVGRNIIKTNNIKNDTFELMQFNDLKPATVIFQ